MSNFIITTDTTSDLPTTYIKEHKLEVFPIYYSLEGVVYGKDVTLTPEDFYVKMRSGQMPTTMAVNPELAKEVFKKIWIRV